MTQPRLLGGRYELGPLLGYGGMAEVHRGRDIRLGRDVAVKVLRSDLARDPLFQARFSREAQASASLNHPAIVAVYDTGEDIGVDGASVPYIVMEFVEGRTLREVLNAEGRLAPRPAMQIVAEICAALDFSHRNGIVHRDIKPGNVMITPTGAVKVMDFGIARALADNGATVTQSASVLGTAQYLSPEQARGENVDARSDVYSTGCLLYELVTGRPPFMGDSPVAVAYQHVREIAPPPSSIDPSLPRAIDAVTMKALAKNPLNRYQTAAEMRNDLARAIAEQPVQAEAVMNEAERTQFIGRAMPAGMAFDDPPPHDVYDDADDRAGKRAAALWISGIAVLLVVLVGAAFALIKGGGGGGDGGSQTPAVKQVAVPLVNAGQTVDSVNAALHQAKLVPDPQAAVPSATIEAGKVISLDPPSGTKVDVNSKVKILISAGKAKVVVPPLIGLTVAQANDKLGPLGLIVAQKSVDQKDTAGTVVDQLPVQQTSVDAGSTVTITVSSGKIPIPNVAHMVYQDAYNALLKAGFSKIDADQQPVQAGYVVGQIMGTTPAFGIAVSPDTLIVMTLAVSPATTPPTTTSPPPLPKCSSSPPPSSPTGTGTASTSATVATPTPSPTCTK
jgi:beta-lactam-binding protein with PASTA domain/predicted Ser/Thr protein kinase